METKGFKKIIASVVLIVMLVSVFAGCSNNKADDPANEPDNDVVDDTNNDNDTDGAETDDGELVTLKWYAVGGGQPANYDAWAQNINPYLEEKINVNIDHEVIAWGDWESRRNVIINSGEEFDILFANGETYVGDIALGAYMDITEMVKTEAPDLYEYIPSDYWDATMVDNKIYSVPTYKDSSQSNYFIWDLAITEKYDIDYENIKDYEALDPALRTIKEGEGSPSLILNRNGLYHMLAVFDNGGVGGVPVGVKYNDDSRKVVYQYEDEDMMKNLEYAHKWYKEGIINPDAATEDEGSTVYHPFKIAQGWKSAAKTVWGPQMGVEADAIKYGDTIVSNATVQGSLNAISANSKNPEKALQFLQLLNLDTKVRDAFFYGLEGENFEYVDGKVKKLNEDWTMAGYTQGTFFTVSQNAADDFNQWDEVKELNENAVASVLLGFTTDTSSIENEIANCRAINEKYKAELLTGTKDPKELVPQMKEELDNAGFQKIADEMQSQIDAAFAN